MDKAQQPQREPAKMNKNCPDILIVKKRLVGNKNRTKMGYCGTNDLTCVWVQENLGCPRTRPHIPAPEQHQCQFYPCGMTLGVGDGTKSSSEGGLFVHGSYEAIKIVQRMILEEEKHDAAITRTATLAAIPIIEDAIGLAKVVCMSNVSKDFVLKEKVPKLEQRLKSLRTTAGDEQE